MNKRTVAAIVSVPLMVLAWYFFGYPLAFRLIPDTTAALGATIALGGITTAGVFVLVRHSPKGKETAEEKKTTQSELDKHTAHFLGLDEDSEKEAVAQTKTVQPTEQKKTETEPLVEKDLGEQEIVFIERVRGRGKVVIQGFKEESRTRMNVEVVD